MIFLIVVIANSEFVLGISAYDMAGMWAVLLLCLLSGAKVTKRFESTKIYDKKVVSFGKRWRNDGRGAFVTDCKFQGAFGYDYYREEGKTGGGGKSIDIGL